MMSNQPVRVAMLGCGRRACELIQDMCKQQDNHIAVVSDPSPEAYQNAKEGFSSSRIGRPTQ